MVGQKLLTMGKQANNHTQTWQKIASRSDMYLKKIGKYLEVEAGQIFGGKLQQQQKIMKKMKNHKKKNSSAMQHCE